MRALEPGDPARVGDYRLLARIGAGGMGTVYLGRSRGGRPVAVKLIDREYVGERGYRDRFRREVAAARRVGGAYSAALLDADPDAEMPWLVSEFLPAVSLREAVRDFGPLPAAAVWMLAAGVAEALAAIHAAGIAHLDLKPANVLLTLDGPRVIDFGIARAADAGAGTVTNAMPIAGSAGYMSPEQAAGAEAGPASDVFSLGTTLAYASTGVEPYGDGVDYVKRYRIQHGAPELDGVADLPLRVLIANLMARDPAARPTATQLRGYLATVLPTEHRSWLPEPIVTEVQRRALEAENPPVAGVVASSPKLSRRALLFGGGGGVVVGVGALAAWFGLRGANPPPSPSLSPSLSPSSSPSSSPSPSAAPTVTLQFYLTGNTTVTSLTYVVNGQPTTLKNLRLPWRKAITVPKRGVSGTWRLRYSHSGGDVQYHVLLNGFELWLGSTGSITGRYSEDRSEKFDA
ncbi:serine/threonine-protein kinase [Fodinicola acaciae]|uniref:serine/threonine-protein kinase n=1 Tax=Fodinicola acaciae TaxID=2681555 RepID=UPI0013D785CE|nr:serine/threonine-protein kinase [Fodinicola acaciae]